MGSKDQRAPFRYVLTWERGVSESIGVEARYQNFLRGRGKEESLELGRVDGERCALLRKLARAMQMRYAPNTGDDPIVIDLPPGPAGEDLGRRVALMASVLQQAPENAALERAYEYLDSASAVEINFWASKLLDQEVGAERVVPAVLLVSRAMRVRPVD